MFYAGKKREKREAIDNLQKTNENFTEK